MIQNKVVADLLQHRADYVTGLKISKPITQKIFKVDNKGKTINYKAGE